MHFQPFARTVESVKNMMASYLLPHGYAVPAPSALLNELRVLPEVGRATARLATSYKESRERTAGGEPVLLIPGFLAGDSTLVAMARHLRGEGFRTYRSSIHANVSCTLRTATMLESRLESIAERRGSRVRIVGHSLGGMLARGLAVRRPDLVSGIVTMGSPVLAPAAHHPLLGRHVGVLVLLAKYGVPQVMSADCVGGECAREGFEEIRSPMPADVAYTAVWSRNDGVVDHRACLDPAAVHVEVPTSHIGMAFDPRTCDAVSIALHRQLATDLPDTLAG
jgi:pimeloyl-ACP methyl ester carboxylesterase